MIAGGRLKMPPKLLPAAIFQWRIRQTFFFFWIKMVKSPKYQAKQQQSLRGEVPVPPHLPQAGALPSAQIQHKHQEQQQVLTEDPVRPQWQTCFHGSVHYSVLLTLFSFFPVFCFGLVLPLEQSTHLQAAAMWILPTRLCWFNFS